MINCARSVCSKFLMALRWRFVAKWCIVFPGVLSLLVIVLLLNLLKDYKAFYRKVNPSVLSAVHAFNPSSTHAQQTTQEPATMATKASTTAVGQRADLLLFVGIYSAPQHVDRRNAIRQTWGTLCKTEKSAVCWFITDGQDVNGKTLEGEVKLKLDNESRTYQDLLLAQSPAGLNFARRYLWMIRWASERYNFKYVLRVDDDYFVCFKKLLLELAHRPKEKLAWGWLHCTSDIVAIDEGFIVVTKDIVESILRREKSTLLCHPYGGQAFAMWLKNISGLKLFGDNKRLFHNGISLYVGQNKNKNKVNEVCKNALGIHRSYPKEMKLFWDIYLKEGVISYSVPPIEFPCNRGLHPRVYGSKGWVADAKLCKDLPVWNLMKFYKGREGRP